MAGVLAQHGLDLFLALTYKILLLNNSLQAAARKGKLRDSYDYFHFLNEFR